MILGQEPESKSRSREPQNSKKQLLFSLEVRSAFRLIANVFVKTSARSLRPGSSAMYALKSNHSGATDCVMLSRASSSALSSTGRDQPTGPRRIRAPAQGQRHLRSFPSEQDQTMILDKYREDGYPPPCARLEKVRAGISTDLCGGTTKGLPDGCNISGTKVFAEVDKRLMPFRGGLFQLDQQLRYFQEERVNRRPGPVDSEIPAARTSRSSSTNPT